ncbi:MAG: DUF3304 domain-containing protein, partial [Burkholderiales bacterium]|nr:DUF3304 domain-containing protein [Burkholderiales bacterium]
VTLSLIAYNYTGRYIDSYAVDGQGGGNAYETTAGGRVVCCLSFRPDSKLPFTVKVEWLLADKRDFVNNKWIAMPDEKRSAIATVYGPIPKEPSEFETHFLPDGSVRVFITEMRSDPYFTPQGVPLRPLPAPGVAP